MDEVTAAATRAREAAHQLAVATRAVKDAALEAMAEALVAGQDAILNANDKDIEAARAEGVGDHLIDRLRLTPERLEGMAQGLRDVAGLPDPVGEVLRGSTLANGLELRQVRVPFGVVGIIYEARPNVTADAAGICLKSGNAVLLRGSASALNSNEAIVAALRDAVVTQGLPADCIQLIPG
ncbi:MAG: aldehyde dehydrogenase family protein, partial [Myxococcales bacterium]